MKGRTNYCSPANVLWVGGGDSPAATPKLRLFFHRVTKKSQVIAPPRKKIPKTVMTLMKTDIYGGQSVEKIGDLQTFMINFSQFQLALLAFLFWFTVELDVLQFQGIKHLPQTFMRKLPQELSWVGKPHLKSRDQVFDLSSFPVY